MATSNNNIITHGLSGKVGDMLVFSQRGGKTIVGKVPDKSHVEQSEKQKQVTAKFQEAVIYAKGAITDEITKVAYNSTAKNGQSAYNVAIADFFNAPKIESINLSGYAGKVGESIIVKATDDFQVKQVTVAIYNEDGSIVEKGEAQLDASNTYWVYVTTAQNNQLQGDKIVIQASDILGNLTESQKNL
jgi:uncharacterized protein YjbJ (UPF0337 family)